MKTQEELNQLWQKCCDEVAIKHGHRDWKLAGYSISRDTYDELYKEAAQLYATEFAREKISEAIELATTLKRFEKCGYTKEEILEKLKLSQPK